MLDIKFIRENSKVVEKASKDKWITVDIKSVLELDEKYKKLLTNVQELQSKKNRTAKEKNVEEGKKIKEELRKKEIELRNLESKLNEVLYQIPNIGAKDVKVGKIEQENEVIKKYGDPTKFSFELKDHLQLGESLDVIDVKRAAKVSGSRFGYLKNEGALLELALVQLAMETLIKEGFVPVIPPVVVTEEQSIVPIHRDEVLQKKNLPKRYVGYSTSFRRESGSYGKDVKGILRLHQFNKVEMVSFVAPEEGDKEHEYLLSLEEKLFQMLEIPYRVVKMCTGDLGFPAARKYDIEAWIPSQNKYREVTSTSTVTDFQSRRLNMKYQDGGIKKYLSVL